jgi:16S rRNA (guanine1207-N2)-methyltransferase
LLDVLPSLAGQGADLGCGNGVLSAFVLKSSHVRALIAFDIDRRAISACRRNIEDPRLTTIWTDIRAQGLGRSGLDFVVTNPPFHAAGEEDQSLGVAFIKVAADSLRIGGTLWLTANRHLPYEAILGALFQTVQVRAQGNGYKVFEAIK